MSLSTVRSTLRFPTTSRQMCHFTRLITHLRKYLRQPCSIHSSISQNLKLREFPTPNHQLMVSQCQLLHLTNLISHLIDDPSLYAASILTNPLRIPESLSMILQH